MKKRSLFYQLREYLDHKNALLVTGMRQVGKTTLMRQLFDEWGDKPKLWFDLDNPLEQKLFEGNDFRQICERLEQLSSLKKKQRLLVCLDEIQNIPEITRLIKYAIDHYSTKFIVTGSSSFYLKNLFPESLSGRKFLFQLEPMSFVEYLYFNDKIDLKEMIKEQSWQLMRNQDEVMKAERRGAYEQYMNYGGFPEVVLSKKMETKKLVLENIFSSFFEKDLKIISDYKDIRELRDLILLLVPRVGQKLDVSRLASELSLSRPKIYEYLLALEGGFFLRLLPRFSRSIDRSVAGGKKVYFSDTGLLRMIGEVNRGQLFENMVINQLWSKGDLSFYNQRNTAEIDVVIDKKIALEIKLRASSQDGWKLKKIADKLNLSQQAIISLRENSDIKSISPFFW